MAQNREGGVDMSLGDRVRIAREYKQFTQAQLADRAAITQATISRIEAGDIEFPRAQVIERLAKALSTSVDFLLGKIEDLDFEARLRNDENAQLIFRGYEKLSEDSRKLIRSFVDFLLKEEQPKKGSK